MANTITQGAGSTQGVRDHNPTGETDSKVFVNGTRIPVANADVHLRKEGPLDITRYAEVRFPAKYQGERYVDAFDTHQPDNQTSFDTLTIELQTGTGDFTTVFRGFVTGVGATDSSPIWECRARGPTNILTNIPAGNQFTLANGDIVINYITNEVNRKFPFPVKSPTGKADDPLEDIQIFERRKTLGNRIFRDTESSGDLAPRTFTENRHTLADVASWLRSKEGLRLWLEPTENGVVLLPLTNPTLEQHDAHYLDGNVQIIENNALSELAPINTLVAKGEAVQSRLGVGNFEINLPQNKYFNAKVRHKQLYQRAGETELHADGFIESDGITTEEVENDAKSGLKDAVDKATAGDMEVLLNGDVIPFDTIRARPTCRSEAEKTVPVTYEVSRVHHMVNPDEGVSRSLINVGVHTDIEQDIEVVRSWSEGR